MKVILFRFVLIFVACLFAQAAAAQKLFRWVDLGVGFNAEKSVAVAINNKGVVVGQSENVTIFPSQSFDTGSLSYNWVYYLATREFWVIDEGTVSRIPKYLGISENGVLGGIVRYNDNFLIWNEVDEVSLAPVLNFGVGAKRTELTQPLNLDFEIVDINDSDELFGNYFASSSTTVPFVIGADRLELLFFGLDVSSKHIELNDVNSSGMVVGHIREGGSEKVSAFWGSEAAIEPVFADSNLKSSARVVNQQGFVFGYVERNSGQYEGFFGFDGCIKRVGHPGNSLFPIEFMGVNSAGVAVGTAVEKVSTTTASMSVAQQKFGFIYHPGLGGFIRLNDTIESLPENWSISEATDINDEGVITAVVQINSELRGVSERAMILLPLSEQLKLDPLGLACEDTTSPDLGINIIE